MRSPIPAPGRRGRCRGAGGRGTLARRGAVVGAVLVASLVGACGGSGGDGGAGDGTTPAVPGASVDPNATGVVGGSINRAKDVADDAESRDAQIDQQGGGGSTTP